MSAKHVKRSDNESFPQQTSTKERKRRELVLTISEPETLNHRQQSSNGEERRPLLDLLRHDLPTPSRDDSVDLSEDLGCERSQEERQREVGRWRGGERGDSLEV